MPYTVFQPLYIYGPHTAKDCEQWFMDRILRDRPVPIPAPGVQLTTLTHVADVASMLAKARVRARLRLPALSSHASRARHKIHFFNLLVLSSHSALLSTLFSVLCLS